MNVYSVIWVNSYQVNFINEPLINPFRQKVAFLNVKPRAGQ